MRKVKFLHPLADEWVEAYFHSWGLTSAHGHSYFIAIIEDMEGKVWYVYFGDMQFIDKPQLFVQYKP